MKAYFVIRDFLENSLISKSSGIALRSYKIDNVETLTTEFYIDNQVVAGDPVNSYYFGTAQADGSLPVPTTVDATTYNPFSKHLGTVYPIVNTMMRGLPTGTNNGNDYGPGVLNIGVDIPLVMTGDSTFQKGAFFIEIDFSKSLFIHFDIITNIHNGQVYQEPYILRQYVIIWDKLKCRHSFAYFNVETGEVFNDDGYGFLVGLTKDNFIDKNPMIDFSQIECGVVNNSCPNKERTQSFALFVTLPEDTASPDSVFKQCCDETLVLADDSGKLHKNDFNGFYHRRQIPSETCVFTLIKKSDNSEYVISDDTYGTFKDFGDIVEQPDLTTFIVEWAKVLEEFGEGQYQLRKDISITGLIFSLNYNVFTLRTFSDFYADKTIRIDVNMDGYLEKQNVNFKDSSFKTSIRIGGFFGRRTPKHEQDNIVFRNKKVEQITSKMTNEYKMQSDLLAECMTEHIIDFILFGDEIFMNDYNLNNHSYKYKNFPVAFDKSDEIKYYVQNRNARLSLTFTDRYLNNNKINY